MQHKIPPYLQENDTIGICCPAGKLSIEDVQPMIAQLEFWGFNVQLGKTIGTSFHKYAASDKERLDDLQNLLDDDNIKAILFARGGYGFVRIIDFVNFDKFKNQPKWLLGFSDITVLHNHVQRHYGIPTIHAHMSGGYMAKDFDNDSTMSIYHTLTGKPHQYVIDTTTTNEINRGKGILVGGNLAILASLVGTPSDINYDGKILVIEDIGEQRYNIDRMLWQLFRAGKLDKLAGLVVGGFTDSKDDEFGSNEYEIVWEKVKHFTYPVCFGFPVGHQAKNMALKFGVEYELISEANKIVLQELTALV